MSKLARLLEKHAQLAEIQGAASRVGNRLLHPRYQMPGDISPDVRWRNHAIQGGLDYIPWYAMGAARSMGPWLGSGAMAALGGSLNWLGSSLEHKNMARDAERQGFDRGYNNPFLAGIPEGGYSGRLANHVNTLSGDDNE